MDKFIPYIIVAVVCLAAGSALMKSCQRDPSTYPVFRDSTIVYVDRVDTLWRVAKPRTEYVTVYTDTGKNSHECCRQLDDCTEQLWTLAGLEVEARKAVDGGTVDVSFSMPVYLESPNDAFRVGVSLAKEPTPPPVEIYRGESWTDQIRFGVHLGYGLGTVPGAQAGVSVQYSPWKLSDIWR